VTIRRSASGRGRGRALPAGLETHLGACGGVPATSSRACVSAGLADAGLADRLSTEPSPELGAHPPGGARRPSPPGASAGSAGDGRRRDAAGRPCRVAGRAPVIPRDWPPQQTEAQPRARSLDGVRGGSAAGLASCRPRGWRARGADFAGAVVEGQAARASCGSCSRSPRPARRGASPAAPRGARAPGAVVAGRARRGRSAVAGDRGARPSTSSRSRSVPGPRGDTGPTKGALPMTRRTLTILAAVLALATLAAPGRAQDAPKPRRPSPRRRGRRRRGGDAEAGDAEAGDAEGSDERRPSGPECQARRPGDPRDRRYRGTGKVASLPTRSSWDGRRKDPYRMGVDTPDPVRRSPPPIPVARSPRRRSSTGRSARMSNCASGSGPGGRGGERETVYR